MRTAAQTAMLMAILTLISKCFGFVREMVMANYFGTSYITDAYVMAIAIPSIVFSGIFGAVAVAYMPIYSEKAEKQGESLANQFTSETINVLLAVSLFSSFIGIMFSDQVVSIFASGFEGETALLTSFFVKITFSYVIFTSITSLLEAYLQYKGMFLPQIIAGYVQNAAVIIITVVSAYFSYYYLAFGWLIAYILRLVIIGGLAQRQRFRYSFTLKMHETMKTIMPLALPVFIGGSISQIGAFVDKTLASGLPEGSVAALNYGSLLVGMISGLTITILTTMTYPKLTQASALNDQERFNSIISKGINLVVIIAAPCTFGSMIYSNQIVQIIYERGAFNSAATSLTDSAFFCYIIGLTFVAINILFVQVFYSNHNSKAPMMFGAVAMIADIILNFVLIGPLGHNGLALSTSIGSIIQMILLYGGIRKYYPEIKVASSKRYLVYIIFSAILAVSGSLVIYKIIENFVWLPRMILFFIAVVMAGLIYLVLLKIFKIEEIKLIKEVIWRK